MGHSLSWRGWALVWLATGNTLALGADEAAPPDFARDVQPILADKCFTCHGPDDAHRQGGLRFDQQESAFGEGDSGQRAIVPGDPAASELVARIASDDDALRMPPPDAEKQLTADEIGVLRRWIAAGAPWSKHWAFITPQRPALPPTAEGAGAQWPRNPIDQFVLARLDVEGLQPAPEADRATLLRRVTLDLTGLPPTPAELESFLRDSRPDAYEQVVERLLTSPRHGEHLARYWLDAARYADTHGLHLDNYREMWPYRDWVIRAFNRNQPFDEFVVEQLAGDLLPNPTPEQVVATGFNRCHVTTSEGGSIEEEVYVRNVVERVVGIGTVMLGLTLDCTRCHDHKYDPLTMNDFYSLFAYFNNLDGSPLDGNAKDHAPVLRVPTEEQQAEIATLTERIAALEVRLRDPWPALDELQTAWETSLLAPEGASAPVALGPWHYVGPFAADRAALFGERQGPEATLPEPLDLGRQYELSAGSLAAWQPRPDWTDGQVHNDLPTTAGANFLLREIHAQGPQKLKISLGSDDALKVYLNGALVHENNVERGAGPDQDALELTLQPGRNELLLKVVNYQGTGGFYFAAPELPGGTPEPVLAAVKCAASERTVEQQTLVREHFRGKVCADAALLAARQELEATRKQLADLEAAVPTTLVWRERTEVRPSYILLRGEYDQHGAERPRATPPFLPPMQADWPNDRLGFARWLTDPSHPLLARVTVNRLWQQFFGTGLVKTADDFGTRSDPPSHPELLDWLAVQLIDDGWDLRQTIRRMVCSATYRQSAAASPELHRRDPENRLLARGPRYRLDAERLRDQALAVSGLLVERLGGPPVKPPQPPGLWEAVGYTGSNTARFTADEGPEKIYRRTVYTFFKRTAPPPVISTFDGPSRESSCVRRDRTNTPLQALLLMNDPQFVEAAQALARRVLAEAASAPIDRARYLWLVAVGRPADAWESDQLAAAVAADAAYYAAHREQAAALAGVPLDSAHSNEALGELAAWTLACNLVLNLDEVVSKP